MVCENGFQERERRLSGRRPLSYQWYKNGYPITGATSSTYTTPPASIADNGSLFNATVTDKNGTTVSKSGVLTVKMPPSITTPPTNQSVTLGWKAKFSVTATGGVPLTYQWFENGIPCLGGTHATYVTLPTTLLDNNAKFTVTVTNASGAVTSTQAILTVH